ncbi:hypothetical protein [Mesorhizobium sp. J428]|uniref:hypothetical protein n=1 Tax=Mesorhizobium sp. J428 TaxID=2898440 RepID=UPI002150AD8E|nr:hypothetical protein [Mesorhizobium sp. J428]MCR5860469.1 hypothetical protein [Mesorhizobium sp. J428]
MLAVAANRARERAATPLVIDLGRYLLFREGQAGFPTAPKIGRGAAATASAMRCLLSFWSRPSVADRRPRPASGRASGARITLDPFDLPGPIAKGGVRGASAFPAGCGKSLLDYEADLDR